MIKELCRYIDAGTSLSRGSTLQVGHRPPTAPIDCVLIAEAGGGATYFDLQDRGDYMIQALARGSTYFTARNLAYVVYNFLHSNEGIDLTPLVSGGDAYTISSCEAVNVPQSIGPDDKGNFEFSTNFIIRIRNTDT